jgi:membrane-bound metal-dependent hydrolase YbcI (DUF457 family)
MGFSLLVGLGLFQDDVMGFIYVPLMVIGSLLPDIDTPFSRLGKYNPFAVKMKHRGFMHSIYGAGIIGVIATIIHPIVGIFITAGYIGHLIADSLTPAGVNWLCRK